MSAPLPAAGVGIDVGSTLTKVAVVAEGALLLTHCPASDRAGVQATLDAHHQAPLAVTGAGAATWAEALAERNPRLVSEFDATAQGTRVLLDQAGVSVSEPWLVVSIGTGTSVVRVEGGAVDRIGGTALGGGTLLGLGALLCGTGEFEALTDLAAAGDRRRADLLVRDVYPHGVEDLAGALTAASFGRVDSRAPEDLAQALCGLLGENLGLLCGALARLHGARQVLYCGATLLENPVLTGILLGTTLYAGAAAQVVPDGAYAAAVGALTQVSWQPGPAA